MKHIFCLLMLGILVHTSVDAQKRIFLQFYDFSGHKFEKGRFAMATDSSISVTRDSLLIEIPVSHIYSIKTKRSYGHNALVSSFALAVTGGIIGYAVGDPKSNVKYKYEFGDYSSKDFTTATGVFLGILSGILAGALISENRQTIEIDGEIENWRPLERRIMKQ